MTFSSSQEFYWQHFSLCSNIEIAKYSQRADRQFIQTLRSLIYPSLGNPAHTLFGSTRSPSYARQWICTSKLPMVDR